MKYTFYSIYHNFVSCNLRERRLSNKNVIRSNVWRSWHPKQANLLEIYRFRPTEEHCTPTTNFPKWFKNWNCRQFARIFFIWGQIFPWIKNLSVALWKQFYIRKNQLERIYEKQLSPKDLENVDRFCHIWIFENIPLTVNHYHWNRYHSRPSFVCNDTFKEDILF